ncbi:DgyrCDS5491 [Dimorphilus gyrociliatus]|uniref:DgyrCDS5491 n=1 Tax=Dimorphilus gyrociliatus TaxID=2664684 RepID=A0A7I8VK66_9ANNE|nr:DgyrCDS5491 [Dimorphilus gyrociliatus]
MATINQGRNEIRVNNSNSKCLLENWVEERNVSHIDPQKLSESDKSLAQILKNGHKGILTTEFDGSTANMTTIRDAFRPPDSLPCDKFKGRKGQLEEMMMFQEALRQVKEEEAKETELSEAEKKELRMSITKSDFHMEPFESKFPTPTAAHHLKEQPATFWTEHRDKIHGKSQDKNFDSCFRKNTSFSKPISERFDDPKPYEQDNWPKM